MSSSTIKKHNVSIVYKILSIHCLTEVIVHRNVSAHYNATCPLWRSKSPRLDCMIAQQLVQANNNVNIKASHWLITGPLWRESSGHRWIPFTKDQCLMRQILMLWIHHHGLNFPSMSTIACVSSTPERTCSSFVLTSAIGPRSSVFPRIGCWKCKRIVPVYRSCWWNAKKWWATLQWRHNQHAGVPNHRCHYCLLNRLYRRR